MCESNSKNADRFGCERLEMEVCTTWVEEAGSAVVEEREPTKSPGRLDLSFASTPLHQPHCILRNTRRIQEQKKTLRAKTPHQRPRIRHCVERFEGVAR